MNNVNRKLSDVFVGIGMSIGKYISTTSSFGYFCSGLGITYCFDKKKYIELPFTFICPSFYIGYKTYKNKDEIKDFLISRS